MTITPAQSAAPAPSHTPLRVGILGCANIAHRFARDTAPCRDSGTIEIAAVASRRPETAAAFAATHAIGRHYGSYEALLADPGIDAIYLPLPNSLHAEWAIKAAEAGKHILCEKPLAMNLAEARAMFDAAERHGVFLLEAYPYEHQPQTTDLLALLGSEAIGAVRSMQASFGFSLANPEGNIRMDPTLGGGALLDAGSYPLSLIRLVMGAAPERVMADASWTDSGVDLSMSATLYYGDGRRAQLSCAMDVGGQRRALIGGTAGTIETEFLNHTSDVPTGDANGYMPSLMRLRRGVAATTPFEAIQSATGSGFYFAAERFAKAVAQRDIDFFSRQAAASLDNAATLAALAESARLQQAVNVPT
jgi:predicted dehydrogenase